jgi:hypothetical protein
MVHTVGDAVLLQSPDHQFRMIHIIFDQHDEDGLTDHKSSPWFAIGQF